MTGAILYRGGPIFDGERLNDGHALLVEGGRVAALIAEPAAPRGVKTIDLAGDILAPGFVDLQVNGGDGVMFNDAPTVETLTRIASAHRRLGTATLLPTLITDTPEHTRAAIEAAVAAIAAGVAGIGGLHLEGPHLSQARKGAHDPALIRPMTEADLALLSDAARRLPVLMVTLAPENATPEQVTCLAKAGAVVSLGHTDADHETCMAYAEAGARSVTHLFNAMSQLTGREPGLVGAALRHGALSAGLIADGFHVHPATMATALAAKAGPGRIFLVSDAMASAGTDLDGFTLNGRTVHRANGRLRLADGTLAGADLDLVTAINVLRSATGLSLAQALAMATSIPAGIARLGPGAGRFAVGHPATPIRLAREDGRVRLVAETGTETETGTPPR